MASLKPPSTILNIFNLEPKNPSNNITPRMQYHGIVVFCKQFLKGTCPFSNLPSIVTPAVIHHKTISWFRTERDITKNYADSTQNMVFTRSYSTAHKTLVRRRWWRRIHSLPANLRLSCVTYARRSLTHTRDLSQQVSNADVLSKSFIADEKLMFYVTNNGQRRVKRLHALGVCTWVFQTECEWLIDQFEL